MILTTSHHVETTIDVANLLLEYPFWIFTGTNVSYLLLLDVAAGAQNATPVDT